MSVNRATVAEQLVSDAEREYTVELLRGHWLAGRLTAPEFEERVGEAWRARVLADLWRALRALPVPRPPGALRPESGTGNAVVALVLGIVALCLLLFSFGLLFPLTLPLSVAAWGLGRSARRRGRGHSGAAAAGEALGAVGTVLATLMLAGCAAIVTAVL